MVSFKNKVQLIGYIGQEVQLRKLNNGTSVATISLATNNSYKKANGEVVKTTDWHTLIAWGRTAELFHELTGKGKQVAVCGQLRYNTYNDKNGKPQRTTQIFVQEFLVLSPADKHSPK